MSAPTRQTLTPFQLNALARDLLEGSFPMVWVEGEIGNLSRPASGHLYFTLKDDRAQVRCALFRNKAMYLRFAPRDGSKVQVRGRLTLYEARGDYQLVLDHMEEAGEGALRQALEALKRKLQAEGLFDSERKRTLPALPRRLGVITSPSGAAVRDVLSVLQRRFPMLDVDVLPVPVQGEGAAAQIVRMLQQAQNSGRYDVLLITRGGGSLEDLWCFNDEALARAVAASNVPVVSAVGHEIDTTLVDYAADLRAATPSAAAELLVPEREALRQALTASQAVLQRAFERRLQDRQQRLDRARLLLDAQRPAAKLQRQAERLNALGARLPPILRSLLAARHARLREASLRLSHQHPGTSIRQHHEHLRQWQHQSLQALRRRLELATQQLRQSARALNAVNPLATLDRGYAIVRDAEGQVLTKAAQASVGDHLDARLAEGHLRLQVLERGD